MRAMRILLIIPIDTEDLSESGCESLILAISSATKYASSKETAAEALKGLKERFMFSGTIAAEVSENSKASYISF